jgi:hypothetical protein
MRPIKLFQTGLFLVAGMVLFTSCRRDREDSNFAVASDNAQAESYFNELKNIADEAYSGTMVLYRSAADTLVYGCATVIRDTTASPKTITVDFGTTNCTCNDGKNRRGKVITTYTGMYRDSGTVITHTTSNYYVNDNQVIGTKTVTNGGHNTAGNLFYNISVSGSVVKANGGGTVTWNSTRVREWIAGASTLIWSDDIYLISGSANGTASNGETFTANITTPLRKEIGCYHFVSGVIEVNPANHAQRIIDFGNGTCDNTATLTINGNTYTINLY